MVVLALLYAGLVCLFYPAYLFTAVYLAERYLIDFKEVACS